ncbi:hypothetical protein Daura_17200 [Dactylosporangium aurantiacum]|uniref:Uncharacterized protein n=1 Tax=Dactylosporangium aurantiacum TaxID=35754 RepID=A0A9Q9MM62_9ACTN|nr:hypothetical protein [Dactylosporangium aurantiacum]MDG6103244.1 hypothetical protein [Dactylosporangium aurantiacum]UWZ57746.1 hypothetical protein Daura_17200 [Dactylosporangium aurantiacum]
MPHPASVRFEIAQIVAALEQVAAALATGPAGDAERLAPAVRRAHGAALRLSAYLDDELRPGHDPGA